MAYHDDASHRNDQKLDSSRPTGSSGFAITRRIFLIWAGGIAGSRWCPAFAAEAAGVAAQPYFAGVGRALEALGKLGAPVAAADTQQSAALARQNDSAAVDAAEKILARYTLVNLSLSPEGPLEATLGSASRTLTEQGWRMFLIRVANPSSRAEDLSVSIGTERTWGPGPGKMMPSNNGLAQQAFIMDTVEKAPLIESMWLLAQLHETVMDRRGRGYQVVPLSGVPVEYHLVQLFSRDHGQRSANFKFYSSPGSGNGFTNTGHREIDFNCLPSRVVTLRVLDTDGRGCVASLTVKDQFDHVYPAQAMRLAPDMFFQPQVYRADGETMRLPDGEYRVESQRGPEYLRGVQVVAIDARHQSIDVKLERWIDPAKWRWYSGDTHIHAGGCAHYQTPTEGVSPETMIRHARGEGLSVGDVLTWGPSWYYQKQFFTGHAESPAATLEHPELQAANHASLQSRTTPEDAESILRYDVEVSGFPSSHAGHLVLLRLRDQDYPGTKLIEDWPSWNLPILKWAREQGAVAGYAHCGSGMTVDSTDLPNYEIPPMDGVGTQEAIVDVTHGVVDFLSGCDTGPLAELNAWYHMLNCGFRLAMIGETDFPCISGERVGVGRSYVRLDRRPIGDEGYEAWIQNLRNGRLYCGDGRSHFLEFAVNGHMSGDADLELAVPGTIKIEALVAARLEPEITPDTEGIRRQKMQVGMWGWHLEQARIGNTREVAVELVVNGVAADRKAIMADGTPRSINLQTAISRSSWVALRIMPSGHTYPVLTRVGGKPIRASKRSAQWCRASVDRIWEVKSPFMRESERPAAAEAFDHARKTYDTIINECDVV
jgi:hypothetical protein